MPRVVAVGALSDAVRGRFGIGFNMADALQGDLSIRQLAGSVSDKAKAAASRSTDLGSGQAKADLKEATPGEQVDGPLFGRVSLSQTSVALEPSASKELWSSKIEIPVVFVFNTPRSGSTLFQMILNTE